LGLSKHLGNVTKKADERKNEKNSAEVRELLSSVRLTLRSIIAILSKSLNDDLKVEIDELQSIFDDITKKLKNV
jgi:hypothetical protein